MRNLVPMIIVAAARSLSKSCPEAPVAKSPEPIAEDRMAQIERFVADNLGLDLSPADLAGHVNVSERQLDRIVTHHKGYSTKKFITRLKLKRAKTLLEETDMTLKAIAEELGFSSEYYFNSVFRKHEGFPPGSSEKASARGDSSHFLKIRRFP